MKKLLCAVIAMTLALGIAAAASAQYVDNGGDDFAMVIDDYAIQVMVTSARTYHISEQITVDFREPMHGILRSIPLFGTEEDYKIENVSVAGDVYQATVQDETLQLTIGSASDVVSGKRVYEISYTLSHPKDRNSQADFIYLNLIGLQWDMPILHAKMTIDFAEGLQPVQWQVLSGPYGSSDNEEDIVSAEYADSGIMLETQAGHVLQPYEGITLMAQLPEGSFAQAPDWIGIYHLADSVIYSFYTFHGYMPIYSLLLIILGLAVLIFAVIMCLRAKREREIIPVISFYAPDGLNPAELGYLIDDYTENEDVTALFFYWASHGHMQIEQGEKKKFAFIKKEPLDDAHTDYERAVFEQMFALGDGTRVTSSQLQNQLYQSAARIKNDIAAKYKGQMWNRRSKLVSAIFRALGSLLIAVSFSYVGFFIFFVVFLLSQFMLNRAWNLKVKRSARLYIGFGVVFCLIAAVLITLALLFTDFGRIVEVSLLILLGMGIVVLSAFMPRRTESGRKRMEGILGFRDFIQTAEKDRLETLLADQPSYFYDVLPYAIVLGVTDLWAEKFEGIVTEPPEWYTYTRMHHPFTTMYLIHCIHHSTQAMTESVISTPASQGHSTSGSGFGGGGGFSGGGFSGGGSGGGGGSGW